MMTAQLTQNEENKPLHIATRMAAAVVARLEQKGECRIAHLCSMGFSLNDIARYWAQACKLAEARRPRMGI
jgi:hypothetical protein